MVHVFLMALLPGVLPAAGLKIDHVTVAGSSLKKMQAGLSAVGIQTVYGGAHSNHATEMALVSFPDGSYLELIALQLNADPQAVDRHEWASFLKADAEPCAWAVREKDLDAEVQRLKSAGVAVSAPVKSGRQRPDGVRLEWETSEIGGGIRGTFFPFLIHDFTDRNQRTFPRGKPVTKDFRSVTRVVIAVKDLDAALKLYRQAYGVPPPIKQVDESFGAHLALLGGIPVVLAQPLTSQSWLNGRIAKFGEGPCAFVLGAANPGHHKAASQSRWFGAEISWFDTEKLGWRLGFEAAGR
jgi:Glyoxalase-like domain